MSKANLESEKSVSFLDKVFKLKDNGTDVRTEILAGITTFLAMAYILFVNPTVLRAAGMNSAGAVGDAAAQFTTLNDPVVASIFMATCVSAAVGTILMGLLANLPFALASGMGLNAFFTYTVVLGMNHTWQEGLAAVFISGIVFFIICVTPLLDIMVKALPQNLKLAITGGIGLFIAFLGLKGGGLVAPGGAILAFGDVTQPAVLITVIGIVVTAVLMALNVKAAMLLGIVVTTIVGIPMGITKVTSEVFVAPPSLSPTFLQMDFAGLLGSGDKGIAAALLSVIMVVITITLVDLFDSIGTLVGTASKAGLINKDGTVKNMNKAMMAASFGIVIGSVCGTSTINTYAESATGVAQGGRTGLTAVTVGVLFIGAMFLTGVVGMVPAQATAPALIMVGVLMLSAVSEIDFSDFTEAVPVFFVIAMMPLSFSIANGISVGLIMLPVMKLATGRGKEVHPVVYVLAILFIIRFIALPH